MSRTILITGASGLIGRSLTSLLLEKGFNVHQLTRSGGSSRDSRVKSFTWDVYNRKIDPACISEVDTIIHLAGEGIADKRWTEKRKRQVIASRTESIRLLYQLIKDTRGHQVKAVISSSAVGYYGDRKDEILTEESSSGSGFLSETCVQWEQAVGEGAELGLRIVKFRTGVVLTTEGGALPELVRPVKFGFGAPLGPGSQWIPWIHVADVVRMYFFATQQPELRGVYNMASPVPVTNRDFTKAIANTIRKPLWLPPVPTFALKIFLGEMSQVVLNSNRTSAEKILNAGFKFQYSSLEKALTDLLGDVAND